VLDGSSNSTHQRDTFDGSIQVVFRQRLLAMDFFGLPFILLELSKIFYTKQEHEQ
jgi:hypothetical protein